MSCYIYYYLKKKDVSFEDWHICLAHLCTSDARELASDLADFKNGETYEIYYDIKEDSVYGRCIPLTNSLLQNTIDYYDSRINTLQKSKIQYQYELNEAKENFLKASTKVVLDDIKETISNREEMISLCDKEINNFLDLKNYIQYAVANILNENIEYTYNQETKEHIETNNYELVYFMG